MKKLTAEQQQLIFDYCMGIAEAKDSAIAQELIFSNDEARELSAMLERSLSPLDSFEVESCPDELAEATVERLKQAVDPGRFNLEKLIAKERELSNESKFTVFWNSFGRFAAAAAVIAIALMISGPSVSYMRDRARTAACGNNLGFAGIYGGLNSFANDNNGQMPRVAMNEGAPWWKVGCERESQKNNSNTRHMWLLVKQGYIEDPNVFTCPGKGYYIRYKNRNFNLFNDFPDRTYVHYSLRVMCNKVNLSEQSSFVVMADMNPLFETIPDFAKQLKLLVEGDLVSKNSLNHNMRGQNVLRSDGSVQFHKERNIGQDEDDIFTVQGVSEYSGVEKPSCEQDSFVAP